MMPTIPWCAFILRTEEDCHHKENMLKVTREEEKEVSILLI